MGWRDIINSPDPSRALYLAMRRNPTASRAADIFQGGFEGAMEGLGNLGQAFSIPGRAVAGAAYNTAVPESGRVDVSDYALYGRDLESGRAAVTYGELLAGTLEDAGEIAPGGMASKLIRLAGDAVTDPAAAPALLSGAEAVGALAGRMPVAAPMTPSRPYRPLSSPQRGGPPAPPAGAPPGPPGPAQPPAPRGPYPPLGPTDTRPTATVRGPLSGQTQPVPRFSPSGHAGWTDPTATQPVRVPPGGGPQSTQAFFPDRTQPVPFNPTATQRVPMTRGQGGRGQLRPKAQRKSRAGRRRPEP